MSVSAPSAWYLVRLYAVCELIAACEAIEFLRRCGRRYLIAVATHTSRNLEVT